MGIENIVNRSTRTDVLERIKHEYFPDSREDRAVYCWACDELGETPIFKHDSIPIDSEPTVVQSACREQIEPTYSELTRQRKITPEDEQDFYTRFGPLRDEGNLVTDSPEQFLMWVQDAYKDGMRNSGFNGFSISLRVGNKKNGNPQQSSYPVVIEFNEQLGNKVFVTQLSYDHVHYTEESTCPQDEIKEQLDYIKGEVLSNLSGVDVSLEGNSLRIEKKQTSHEEEDVREDGEDPSRDYVQRTFFDKS